MTSGLEKMNKPVSATSLVPSRQVDLRSAELDTLLAQIAEGESDRERVRILPFEAIDLIRRAKLGALRLPTSAGGAGSTIRELAQQPAKAELKVGFVPGPYIDEFKAGVEPELKKKAIPFVISSSRPGSRPTMPCSRATSTPMSCSTRCS
jgi:hypothetical protein